MPVWKFANNKMHRLTFPDEMKVDVQGEFDLEFSVVTKLENTIRYVAQKVLTVWEEKAQNIFAAQKPYVNDVVKKHEDIEYRMLPDTTVGEIWDRYRDISITLCCYRRSHQKMNSMAPRVSVWNRFALLPFPANVKNGEGYQAVISAEYSDEELRSLCWNPEVVMRKKAVIKHAWIEYSVNGRKPQIRTLDFDGNTKKWTAQVIVHMAKVFEGSIYVWNKKQPPFPLNKNQMSRNDGEELRLSEIMRVKRERSQRHQPQDIWHFVSHIAKTKRENENATLREIVAMFQRDPVLVEIFRIACTNALQSRFMTRVAWNVFCYEYYENVTMESIDKAWILSNCDDIALDNPFFRFGELNLSELDDNLLEMDLEDFLQANIALVSEVDSTLTPWQAYWSVHMSMCEIYDSMPQKTVNEFLAHIKRLFEYKISMKVMQEAYLLLETDADGPIDLEAYLSFMDKFIIQDITVPIDISLKDIYVKAFFLSQDINWDTKILAADKELSKEEFFDTIVRVSFMMMDCGEKLSGDMEQLFKATAMTTKLRAITNFTRRAIWTWNVIRKRRESKKSHESGY